MPELHVEWKHLSVNGKTCPRCSSTGSAVRDAVKTLERILAPHGIHVRYSETELRPEEFSLNPLASNEIRINGRLLEEWLGARTEKTICCDVCGDRECRAVELNETLYEAIPPGLIVKAGLAAALHLLNNSGCCESSLADCCGD